MQEKINYGIDLGTTNSAIGFYSNGKVNVLKNPRGFKEILPSVVAFRKGRVLIGDKAIEQLEANSENVFSSFKRDMGTDVSYLIESNRVTPLDLSAHVLRELLAFVQDEKITSAVITIPASFDIVQSNATKKAGFEAGLNEVILLQEPVAACLAYANENNLDLNSKQTWLVYDFGGGTFDSALVEIDYREMKVKDHLGNNFLGGVDIDNAIFKSFILPKLKSETGLDYNALSADSKDFKKFNQYLIYKIEEAKKELSLSEFSMIEIDYPDLDIYIELKFTRIEFNSIVAPVFIESVDLLKELLTTNNLSFSDINRIVLVGGTTYIPFIREGLKELTGTSVDSSIDPTTAIVKGAAYFAGTKEKSILEKSKSFDSDIENVSMTLIFENTSNDAEELITVQSDINLKGQVRIIRLEEGYDSGLLEFDKNVSQFVPVLPKQINHFTITVFDKKKRLIYQKEISISQGLYSISGQTLPLDICLEVDSDDGNSYLEPIFKKNSILPLKKTIHKTLSKSVSAGSEDAIFINVLEGKRGTMPGSNLSIGFIAIKGMDIANDLIRGTQVELNFSMSESRDLKIDVCVPSSDLILKEKFNPHIKIVLYEKINLEIEHAIKTASLEIKQAIDSEQFELAARFKKLEEQLSILLLECKDLYSTSLYKTDEKKRVLLKELDGINRSKHIFNELEAFNVAKERLLNALTNSSKKRKDEAKLILKEEKGIINSGDKQLIRFITKKIETLLSTLFYENDENFVIVYFQLKLISASEYKDFHKVEQMIEEGDTALQNKNYSLLKKICVVIANQLKEEKKSKQDPFFVAITGLK